MAEQRNAKNTIEHAGFAHVTDIPVECGRKYHLNLPYSRRHTPYVPATLKMFNLKEKKKLIMKINYKKGHAAYM